MATTLSHTSKTKQIKHGKKYLTDNSIQSRVNVVLCFARCRLKKKSSFTLYFSLFVRFAAKPCD